VSGERDDGAVMIGIHGAMEHRDAWNGADGRGYGVDDRWIPSLGEIGDALDYFAGHVASGSR